MIIKNTLEDSKTFVHKCAVFQPEKNSNIPYLKKKEKSSYFWIIKTQYMKNTHYIGLRVMLLHLKHIIALWHFVFLCLPT